MIHCEKIFPQWKFQKEDPKIIYTAGSAEVAVIHEIIIWN